MMGLDELFDILDCYVEESQTIFPTWEPNKVWYSDKITCKKDYPIANENCLKYYDRNTTTTAESGPIQLTACH